MDQALAYKCQMLPAAVRKSRNQAHATLLKTGWPVALLDAELDDALAWANSHCLTVQQEKIRLGRAKRKEVVKNADALDMMFQSAGIDPATIPRKYGASI